MTTYFHGSNSASLVGILNKEKPGLRPLGVLLSEGKAPFCGEYNLVGNKESYSKDGIAAVEKDCIASALRYATATFGRGYGWNPDQSKKFIEKEREELVKKRKNLPPDLQQWFDKVYDYNVHIELLREKQWKQLSEEEKILVQNPFPILYGIIHEIHEGQVRYHHSDISGDCSIHRDLIPLRDIWIFTPYQQIERVSKKWFEVDDNPKVLPFTFLQNFIQEIEAERNKQDARRELEELLAQTQSL